VIFDDTELKDHLIDLSEGIKLEQSAKLKELDNPAIDIFTFIAFLTLSRSKSPSEVKTLISFLVICIVDGQDLVDFEK